MTARTVRYVAAVALAAAGLLWSAWPNVQLMRAAHLLASSGPDMFRQTNSPPSGPLSRDAQRQILSLIHAAESRRGTTAHSLLLRGRLELARGDFNRALSTFQAAGGLGANASVVDLYTGITAGSRASQEDRPADNAVALEHLLRAAESPDVRPVAEYNAAVVAERLPALNESLRLWRRASVQPAADYWRARIRMGAERVERRLTDRVTNVRLALNSNSPLIEPLGSVDRLIGRAVSEWLPNRSTHKADLVALSISLKEERKDPWLVDFLAARKHPAAEGLLAESVSANNGGNHETAALLAGLARSHFQVAGNKAGIIYAAVEQSFALQRLGDFSACLANLRNVRRKARALDYKWLEHRAWAEEITCKSQSRTVEFLRERELLAASCERTGYASLHLRTAAFLVEPAHSHLTPTHVWNIAHRGLESFWRSALGPVFATNFYIPLALAAENSGYWRTALLLMREAAAVARDMPNQRLRGQILAELGAMELRHDRISSGAESLKAASALFPNGPDAESTALLAQIATAHSDIAAGHNTRSITRLGELLRISSLPGSGIDRHVRMRLHPVLGYALRARGELKQALAEFESGTKESLDILRSIHDDAQREFSLREAEASWRGLVTAQSETGDVRAALESWQTFRSARRSRVRAFAAPAPGVAYVSYAVLASGIGSWMVNSSGMAFEMIPAQSVLAQARTLSTLVQFPEVPAEEIRDRARKLYTALVRPFEDRLRGIDTLIVDADGDLATIPWGVLENVYRIPLAERFAIAQANGWAEAQASGSAIDADRALVVGAPLLKQSALAEFPPLPEVRLEAANVARCFRRALLLQQSEAQIERMQTELPGYPVFHFAGHGSGFGGLGALVLPSDHDAGYRLLTARDIAALPLNGVRLVTLSACAAAAGEQRGRVQLDSLVRAFLHAGAERVVAARWNVDSGAAATFFRVFYNEVTGGNSPARALQRASVVLRSRPQTSHPYYWAAFAVHGAP